MDLFTVLFYQPIFNAIVVLYRLLGENMGLAIIGIALLSRLITLPITLRQTRMMKSSQELNAKLQEVKQKHKNNKEKQQQEMMKIQSEYLPAQLSGCLPLILQTIFFINIYNVINNLIQHGVESFNTVAYNFVPLFSEGATLQTSFLGIIDLKAPPSQFSWENLSILPYIILIVLVGVSQFYSMRLLTPGMGGTKNDDKAKNKKEKKGKEDKPEDFGEIMQQSTRQTMLLFPFLVSIISYSLASGLSLYWIAQSGFLVIQQLILKRVRADAAGTAVETIGASEAK